MMQPKDESWKGRTFAMFGGVGAALGVVTAYLYVRSAEEQPEGERQKLSTGTMISLLLATLALIRQIAESGKPKK